MDPVLAVQLAFAGIRLVLDVVEGVQGARENLDAYEALLFNLHAENRAPTQEEVAQFVTGAVVADDALQDARDRLRRAVEGEGEPDPS